MVNNSCIFFSCPHCNNTGFVWGGGSCGCLEQFRDARPIDETEEVAPNIESILQWVKKLPKGVVPE